jgi:low temperature requirement protein LtrA
MDGEFKKASWLELFYDIAFVALVAQLTYLASSYAGGFEHWVLVGVVGYAIFTAWWATTANRNFQPTENTTDKLLVQLQMVGMFTLSLTMPALFKGDFTAFFITLGSLRALQAFMMGRMYYLYPELRPKTYNILEGFLVGSFLWIMTAFMPVAYLLVTALMALTIDILTPLTRGKGNNTRYLNVYHLQERLGLFLMLVIGESMIVVALSSSAADLSSTAAVVVMSGLGLMIAFWWLYFEHSDRYSGNRPKNLFYYLHAHGVLFLSLMALSVGYRQVLSDTSSSTALVLIVGGSVCLALSLMIVRAMTHPLCRRGVYLALIMCGATIVIAWFAVTTKLVTFTLLIITILFSIVALLDARGVFRSDSGMVKSSPSSEV